MATASAADELRGGGAAAAAAREVQRLGFTPSPSSSASSGASSAGAGASPSPGGLSLRAAGAGATPPPSGGSPGPRAGPSPGSPGSATAARRLSFKLPGGGARRVPNPRFSAATPPPPKGATPAGGGGAARQGSPLKVSPHTGLLLNGHFGGFRSVERDRQVMLQRLNRELHRERERLHEDFEDVEDSMRRLQEENAELRRRKHAQFTREVEDLRAAVADLRAENGRLADAARAGSGERDELRGAVVGLEERNARLKAQLGALREELGPCKDLAAEVLSRGPGRGREALQGLVREVAGTLPTPIKEQASPGHFSSVLLCMKETMRGAADVSPSKLRVNVAVPVEEHGTSPERGFLHFEQQEEQAEAIRLQTEILLKEKDKLRAAISGLEVERDQLRDRVEVLEELKLDDANTIDSLSEVARDFELENEELQDALDEAVSTMVANPELLSLSRASSSGAMKATVSRLSPPADAGEDKENNRENAPGFATPAAVTGKALTPTARLAFGRDRTNTPPTPTRTAAPSPGRKPAAAASTFRDLVVSTSAAFAVPTAVPPERSPGAAAFAAPPSGEKAVLLHPVGPVGPAPAPESAALLRGLAVGRGAVAALALAVVASNWALGGEFEIPT